MAFLFASALIAPASARSLESRVEHVDTRRGTDSRHCFSHGNTFPTTARPFGFNFWTPLTQADSDTWLYRYDVTSLIGFGLSHQASPWMGDYGTLQIWGQQGDAPTDPAARRTAFRHINEVARPYMYAVTLDSGTRVAIAPTNHAAVFKFTFPTTGRASLLFDTVQAATGDLHAKADEHSLRGYTEHAHQRMYIFATWSARPHTEVTHAAPPRAQASVTMDVRANEDVELRIGTSWMSILQAQKNLQQEVGNKTWEAVAEEGRQAWDAVLGRIDIEASPAQTRTFYANLARVHVYPNERSEITGGESHYMSPYDQRVHRGTMWVNNGFWDTSRAAWPLLMLLWPEQTGSMLQGFVQAYQEGGWTPRWTAPGYRDIMVGTHTDIMFADAYFKNIPGIDYAQAYQSALKNATVVADAPELGRAGLHRSNFLGYLPTDVQTESAAWFLEDTLNDFGIARLAGALNKPDEATYFANRAQYYVHLFSPTQKFFRGRTSRGAFRTTDANFVPQMWGHEFTEGCAWHYIVPAPHDARGMAHLYGGLPQMARKIDAVFAADSKFDPGSYETPIHEMTEAVDGHMGQYAHANEPVHHMIYMYNYAGEPAQTQRRVRDVLHPKQGIYTLGEDGGGYLGDEDNGQMSAWYVFSALGFYPAAVGRPEYAIGSPLFARATIHLDHDRDFTVEAPNNSDTNVYIQSATLRGAPYHRNYLHHQDILQGGTLVLQMGPKPSNFGTSADALPTSLTMRNEIPRPQVDLCDGGTARTSSDVGRQAAFDNDAKTVWLAHDDNPWLSYEFADRARHGITQYTLTSGNLQPSTDPRAWQLQGSNDGKVWDTLDVRRNETFAWRYQTRVWSVRPSQPYRMVRLNFIHTAGVPLAVAEVEFLGTPAPRD